MKYLVFSHFLNRSLQQNNYSLSTVTRWWCFAEELRGTCFLGKTFSVVLGIKPTSFCSLLVLQMTNRFGRKILRLKIGLVWTLLSLGFWNKYLQPMTEAKSKDSVDLPYKHCPFRIMIENYIQRLF